MPKPLRILDVGGVTGYFPHHEGVSLTVLNIYPQSAAPGEEVLVGNGCDLSQFKDRSFDLVFSNSAIAFVGNQQRQEQMASEMRRVGVRYYLQTPNQSFPIDWRTYAPFYHWLPVQWQAWILSWMSVGRYPRHLIFADALALVSRVRDVDRKGLRHLFPLGTVTSEKVLGFTKSFEVWGKN